MPLAGAQFQHAGSMVFFDRHGEMQLRISETERLVNGMLDNLMDIAHPLESIKRKYPDSIRDHFVGEYIRVLEGQVL
ncbi:MAG: hypothetical protein PHQ23_15020 [Candidatus Wallbacteria bacterium]|nr:hypothetical protein [Candidatus Wallbacteria bacterium]